MDRARQAGEPLKDNVALVRFADGRVAESWHYWDTARLDVQLGTA